MLLFPFINNKLLFVQQLWNLVHKKTNTNFIFSLLAKNQDENIEELKLNRKYFRLNQL